MMAARREYSDFGSIGVGNACNSVMQAVGVTLPSLSDRKGVDTCKFLAIVPGGKRKEATAYRPRARVAKYPRPDRQKASLAWDHLHLVARAVTPIDSRSLGPDLA